MQIIFIVFLLLFPFISANKIEDAEGKTYNLYEKTVIIFGKSKFIKDTFTTPPDCKKISVNAEVGSYFTGSAGIFIRSEGHKGAHTIWGTGLYIF